MSTMVRERDMISVPALKHLAASEYSCIEIPNLVMMTRMKIPGVMLFSLS
jgi:hypothetical protein